MVKTVIGILSYNDKHYLQKTLPVLSELSNAKIIILDNAHNDEVQKFVTQNYPQIDYIRHADGNLGFGKGHNYIVLKSPPSDYYFCLNNDILLEPKGYKACVDHLDDHKKTCMVSSKLYNWDFKNDKTTTKIDTFGIIANRAHHFWDRGQGKQDKGQYDSSINQIFGISGAAFFIRCSCISKLNGASNEIFDENFFMYKEDIDLSYRMRWLGLKIEFLPNILGYHDRTVARRSKKSKFERAQSYKNHLVMLRNNFSGQLPLGVIYRTFVFELMKFVFNIKFLKEFKNAFKVKIHKSTREVSPRKIQKYLLK